MLAQDAFGTAVQFEKGGIEKANGFRLLKNCINEHRDYSRYSGTRVLIIVETVSQLFTDSHPLQLRLNSRPEQVFFSRKMSKHRDLIDAGKLCDLERSARIITIARKNLYGRFENAILGIVTPLT